MTDVVGIGENSVDLLLRIPSPPAADGKQQVSGRRLSPGGQVATTLSTCAALGLRTAYVGAFGSDDHGQLIREALVARGVDVSAAVTRQVPNRFAVILVDARSGGRSVFFQRDPELALQPAEIPTSVLASARVVHVDGTDPEASLHAAAAARAGGGIVTLDVDGDDEATRQLIDVATHPILAEHVPAALTGYTDLELALRALRQPHHDMLCVTRGARGAALLVRETFFTATAPPVAVVDTTGAGDVFRGAFIYALLRGDAPQDLLNFATAAAAISCTREGAMESVPFHGDMDGPFPPA